MSETVVGLAARDEACSIAFGDALPERATVAHDIKTFVRRFGESPEPDARRDALRLPAVCRSLLLQSAAL